MAQSIIEKLHIQAKSATQEDIDKICSSILDLVYLPEKLAECVALLRQLYFILQASSTQPCVPTKLIATMLASITSPGKLKVKDCLLCNRILEELLPFNEEHCDKSTELDENSALYLQLKIVQGNKGCINKMIPVAVSWLKDQDLGCESQRQAFSFLVAVSILHGQALSPDAVKSSSGVVSDWLMNASLYQATSQSTIFRKEQKTLVTELDGTASTNFFTVLNVGQYYTDDQMLNIHSFSMLYQWMYHTFSVLSGPDTDLGVDGKTTPSAETSLVRRVYQSLVGASLDYCFRLLDQCERKPKVAADAELQSACLIETVKLLDIICKIDKGQIPKVFREMQRLSSRMSQDPNSARIQLIILQFQMNHCAAVAYDPHADFSLMFHRVIMRTFNNPSVAFDIVMFIRDNLEQLCLDYQILATYFPNIFKLLAWNPRTFVSEFVEIVPAMMSASTSLEVFHTLVDLPCMTAALEVIEKFKNIDLSTLPPSASDLEPATSVDAFKSPMFRPMFNFFTRTESGHGDTINRLDKFHTALQDLVQHPRVMVCYQVVPVLLKVWFSVILKEGSSEFVTQLLPVLMERTGLLFGRSEYQTDIKQIVSEKVVLLLKKHPQVVLQQRAEIMDFLASPRNIIGREDFFCHLVWAVGEYSSATYDEDCSADTVGKIYEGLEVLSYEVMNVTASLPAEVAPYTIKVVSILMSAIAKLAIRCQDLIPRAILCLTKVAKQHQNDFLETDQQEILFNKAQELINLLKLPNFASVILNPPPQLETNRIHRDSTSMASLLRGTYRLMAPNM